VSEVRIAAQPRTEFGKGAARRCRGSGRVPAVLYGHGTDTKHISLPGHDLMLALKTPNVLLRVQGVGDGEQLALPKDIQRDPLKGFLRHVDLLLVRRGEKVTVEVPVQLTGEAVPGGLVDQQMVQVALEVEATRIPGGVEVDITGMDVGAAVHARDLRLPSGSTLVADPDSLVVHVIAAPTAEQIEAELGEVEPAAEPAEIGEEEEESQAEGAASTE
jgi:large subunit ribosomal protein L25